MNDEEKISSIQLIFLLVIVVTSTAWLFVPALTAQKAGVDGWISLLAPATIFGMAVVFVCSSLYLRFPGRSVVEFSGDIVGKFTGKIVGLGYLFYFLHSTG